MHTSNLLMNSELVANMSAYFIGMSEDINMTILIINLNTIFEINH
jgi:hypothetical protein